MKSLVFTVVVAVGTLVHAGCDRSNDSRKRPTRAATATASKKKSGPHPVPGGKTSRPDSEDSAAQKDPIPLSQERLRTLVLALAPCKLTERGIDDNCAQYKALEAAKRDRTTWDKKLESQQGPLGLELLKQPSDPIRHYAVTLMGTNRAGGVKRAYVKTIIKASETEANAAVLKNMIYTLASNQDQDRKVGRWILGHLAHSQPLVRKQAIMSLTTWGKKTKGVAKAILQTLSNDKSSEVRQAACKGIGDLEDASVIPTLKTLLTEQSTEVPLYEACFIGLIKMWTRYVMPPERPSAAAYKLTLALLRNKPRDTQHPPFQIVNYLGGLKSNSSQQDAWRKAAKFYNADEFQKAAAEVVSDPNASWISRNALLALIADMGASRASLSELRKTYAGKEKEGGNNFVVRTLDKRIAAAR